MTVVGFTGTRHGMAAQQQEAVRRLVSHTYDEAHHGDCVGSDEMFHDIATDAGIRTVIHPPSLSGLRAWCEGDEVLAAKPYLDRNRDIVDACDLLVATPAEPEEQSRGGTWYTIRYARTLGKPVVIVWPNGEISYDS